MHLVVEPFTVHKRFPLTISRGTTSETTNLWVILSAEGIEGWGEASPFSVVQEELLTTEQLLQQFQTLIPRLESFHPWQRQAIETFLCEANVAPSVRAAIDTALWDWLGKRLKLPLWQLWGLDRSRIPPTSVTIGINSPEVVQERINHWQTIVENPIFKLKLGNKAGIEADKAMLLAVRQAVPHATLTVDANGGWNWAEAIEMSEWLWQQKVKYIEQPLPVGEESHLAELYERSPLPIFVDESCFTSQDIPQLAPYIHGINLKLMKAGGLSEIRRAIATAQACHLQIMFGCYSDSSLANTAMSHLAPLADYLDLDSHLNLTNDPFAGASLEKGQLMPNHLPGLGVKCVLNPEDENPSCR